MTDQNDSIELSTPNVDELNATIKALRGWQHDGEVVQLHSGDLGWYGKSGPQATVDAIRRWSRKGELLAIGLLDGPDLLRLAIAPQSQNDSELAEQMTVDITHPEFNVLPQGNVYVEARTGDLLNKNLIAQGWYLDEPWTSLGRDLTLRIEDCNRRIEIIESNKADVWCTILRAVFDRSSMNKNNWDNLVASQLYKDARCLMAYDENENAVAIATVWSAGPGKPGLIEPMGVDPQYRNQGHGKAITLACATALQEMGSSSVIVCTKSSELGAVATYKSAGLQELSIVQDLSRGE